MAATTPAPPDPDPNGHGSTWQGIELRHLLALLAVADEGTFSAAAERLGYTQPAVSQQISTLERIVRATLFDRPGGPRPVRLTEAGESLVAHARAVLGQLRMAEADVRALTTGQRGRLRVGTIQSVGTKVLPALLRRFTPLYPEVEITLRESHDPVELAVLVAEGELDTTFFAPLPAPDGPFEVRWLLDDPYVAVVPASAPEAERRHLSIDELSRLPLIGTRHGGACQATTEELFRHTDEPRFVFRSDDNSTVQGCIAAGLAYGLLPLLAVDEADPSVAVLPIEPPVPPRQLGLVVHAERRAPAALAPFVDAAADVCVELAALWARETVGHAQGKKR
jgi:DNA-binding transcriptional LysR family regulator